VGVRARRGAQSQKKTLIASEQDRPDVARRRMQWKRYRSLVDPSRLVFIDETWTKTNMAPLRGWGPRGERLKAKVPHGRWRTMTFVAALRCDRIEAPWLIDRPINGERFRTYVEKVLLPTLRPTDIVVADNLGSHRGRAVRHLIRSVGAKLFFLPKYSPDLNPIEQFFSKLKHCLRKAAKRTFEDVSDEIGRTLETVTAPECRNYFVNSGYDPG
jgi:transposase